MLEVILVSVFFFFTMNSLALVSDSVPNCGKHCEVSQLARQLPTASFDLWGAGTAQWLEHQILDGKVMGSSPGRNSRSIFFCRVSFLC